MNTKTCTRCRLEKPLSEFGKRAALVGGHRSECKECQKNDCRRRRAKAPERAAEIVRKSHLKHTYGLTLEDYDHMFAEQLGRCPICSRPLAGKKLPPVDHNHKTGKVRAILCLKCNVMLGAANDEISTLTNAIRYLERHGA